MLRLFCIVFIAEKNGSSSAALQSQQEVSLAFNLNNGKEDESGKEHSKAEQSDILQRYRPFRISISQALYFCA